MYLNRLNARLRDPQLQRDLAVWTTLVAFGVIGRWLQPTWQVTPTAAVGLFAGYYFARISWAVSVPIAVIALSHSMLPPYASWGVMAAVLVAFVLPAILGRMLSHKLSVPRFVVATLLPSLFFFATTNFAVWAFLDYYPHTLSGLAACYAHAIPFYRWMLEGDLVYIAIVFGTYAFAVRQSWLPREARLSPATGR